MAMGAANKLDASLKPGPRIPAASDSTPLYRFFRAYPVNADTRSM
jgi:hypothetical protein